MLQENKDTLLQVLRDLTDSQCKVMAIVEKEEQQLNQLNQDADAAEDAVTLKEQILDLHDIVDGIQDVKADIADVFEQEGEDIDTSVKGGKEFELLSIKFNFQKK